MEPPREPGGRPAEPGGHRLLSLLGRGGMGEVWLAEHLPTGARRALKLLGPTTDVELRLRFRREGQAMARVGVHPHLVRVHAAGEDGGWAWLAMDHLAGGDLAARLRSGPLAVEAVVELGRALAAALAHLHAAGVLHRDLKPQNVLYDEGGAPRLSDLGLARLDDASQALTRSGAFVGTPAYAAPEQVRGEAVDERADVYGLGALLYHALTGAPPFAGSSPITTLAQVVGAPPPPPSRLRGDVPPWLEQVLLRCLEKAPERRFGSARAAGEALAGAQAAPGRGSLRLAAALLLPAALLLAWWVGRAQSRDAGPAAAGGSAAASADSGRRAPPPGPSLPGVEELRRLLAADQSEAVLDALSGHPRAGERWRELAAALLCVGDPERLEAWAARETPIAEEDGRALVAAVVSARRGTAPTSSPGAGDGVVAVAGLARAERRLQGELGQLGLHGLDRLEALFGAVEAPGAIDWLRPALALRAQRVLVENLAQAVSVGRGLPRARSHEQLERLRRLVTRSRWAGGLDLLELWLEYGREPDQPPLAPRGLTDEGWPAALEPLPAPLRERCALLLEVLPLTVLPTQLEVGTPGASAALRERCRELRRRGCDVGWVDADGVPLTPEGNVALSLAWVHARLFLWVLVRETQALLWQAWHHRGDPARRAEALAAAASLVLARKRSDENASGEQQACLLLFEGRPRQALEALQPLPPRPSSALMILAVQAGLAARSPGEPPGEVEREGMGWLERGAQRPIPAEQAVQARLRALRCAAAGDAAGAQAALGEAAGHLDDYAPFLPWLDQAGAARQVELLLAGVEPAEALRRVIDGD